MFYLMTHSTHFILRLYGVGYQRQSQILLLIEENKEMLNI